MSPEQEWPSDRLSGVFEIVERLLSQGLAQALSPEPAPAWSDAEPEPALPALCQEGLARDEDVALCPEADSLPGP